MDSVTQFVLGAAIGEAVLGKKEGNKAILWGGIAGTIPDMDVLFSGFMTDLQVLSVHRGFSHSLIFAFLVSPLIAWLAKKIHQNGPGTYKDWLLLMFLGLFTHPILDSFTTYGTQLFLPFSDYRVGFNNLFIIDPTYTIPLILAVVTCLFLKRDSSARKKVIRTALIVTTSYIALTLIFKLHVNDVMKTALTKQEIKYDKFMTGTTPLQSLLWYSVAKTDSGCYMGYYSIFDRTGEIDFVFYNNGDESLKPFEGTYALDRLKWFSNDYYVAREFEGQHRFYTVKFGRTDLDGSSRETAFVWYFVLFFDKNGVASIKQPVIAGEDYDYGKALAELWVRIKGV